MSAWLRYPLIVVARMRSRLALMTHPNYRAFKHHLRSVWTGK